MVQLIYQSKMFSTAGPAPKVLDHLEGSIHWAEIFLCIDQLLRNES